ncbi:MAG: TrkA family potassium uptake protein [Candidatus Izimaplasma sp.]|nr:TrkA family potassium uptake protein [Candidatus Izimaplasma bacterium]
MKIVISEGSSQADFLVRMFQNKKHQIILINSDKNICEYLKNHDNVFVYYGDPTKKYVLEEAQIKNADIFISLSESDELNYVACQLAKKNFNVSKTIATVSNPKDVNVFEQLGIDSALSSTYLVAKIIENESLSNEIYELLNIDNNNVTLSKIELNEESKFIDEQLKNLELPININISCILRNDDIIIPNGNTVLKANDVLYIVTKSETLTELNDIFAFTKEG